MASSNDVMPSMLFSGPLRDGKGPVVDLAPLGGGAGGRARGDGMDGIQVNVTNTSNLPAEALEIDTAAAWASRARSGRCTTNWPAPSVATRRCSARPAWMAA
ncbi:hypothetical protein G6F57_021368 [Rhizopus arrhizus]|nr:hypothetical protein G6F57_021368 [Rhizopus arrhizus]